MRILGIVVLAISLFLAGCSSQPAKAYTAYINAINLNQQIFYINGVFYLHQAGKSDYRIDGSAIKVTSDKAFKYIVQLNGTTTSSGYVSFQTGTGYESYVLEVN